jgi:hypothetical protein
LSALSIDNPPLRVEYLPNDAGRTGHDRKDRPARCSDNPVLPVAGVGEDLAIATPDTLKWTYLVSG